MIDETYIDKFISDGQKETLALKNLYDTMLVTDLDREHVFRVPQYDFFLKYRDQLAQTVRLYQVPQEQFYRPKTVSFELYGTTELWLALLRLNNMRNITEFHLPIIKVYNATGLKTLIDIFFKREGVLY